MHLLLVVFRLVLHRKLHLFSTAVRLRAKRSRLYFSPAPEYSQYLTVIEDTAPSPLPVPGVTRDEVLYVDEVRLTIRLQSLLLTVLQHRDAPGGQHI